MLAPEADPSKHSASTLTVPGEPTLQLKLQPSVTSGPSNIFRYSTCPRLSAYLGRPLRLNPLTALEPARKKLRSVEAQRVMAVFDETIRRVQIVTLLPYLIEHLDRFEVALGVELVELLKHHSVVNSSYADIKQQLTLHMGRKFAMKKGPLYINDSKEIDPTKEEAEPLDGSVVMVSGKSGSTVSGGADSSARKTPVLGSEWDSNSTSQGSQRSGQLLEDSQSSSQTSKTLGSSSKKDQESPQRSQEGQGSTTTLYEIFQDSWGTSEGQESIDSTYDACMRNLSLVAEQISHSTRNILRAFSMNPIFVTTILEQMHERDPVCCLLVQYLKELREILLHKLLTTPQEERERMAYIHHVSKRERLNAAIIEKLEYELRVKIDDKEHEIMKRNEVIMKLQTELHQVEKLSEEHIRRLRGDAEKQEAADEKTSEGKQQKLEGDVSLLHNQLQNAIMEHRIRELDLRSKKYKVESEVESWIQKYDEELGVRQDEYEEIDAIYTEEKKQLRDLEDRFSFLEKEYVRILRERQLARERRQKEERILAMRMRAAITIQSIWRCYRVRKALKTRKKKRGGGGGKKKTDEKKGQKKKKTKKKK